MTTWEELEIRYKGLETEKKRMIFVYISLITCLLVAIYIKTKQIPDINLSEYELIEIIYGLCVGLFIFLIQYVFPEQNTIVTVAMGLLLCKLCKNTFYAYSNKDIEGLYDVVGLTIASLIFLIKFKS